MNVEIDKRLFNDVYFPYLDDMARTQIIFGGSGSGKSVFLAQRCIIDIMRGGRNYLVCRAVGRTIRRSVFNEIRKVIYTWNLNKLFKINKSDGVITCTNGYQIIFAGLDDTEKVKSITPEKGVITDIWVEEATETEEKTIKDLFKRQRGGRRDTPKRLTMSFNPIYQGHWIYKKYFAAINWAEDQTQYKADGISILKTWYIHNRFLTPEDIQDLVNEPDKYYLDVYTLGNWGVLGNVIFTNWKIQDLSELYRHFTRRRNGLDFGFSSDPAAVTVSHYDRKHKAIYIFKEFYEKGLTNNLLANEILAMIGEDMIICDSAEPKSIAELKQHGVRARPASKGKDSVLFGIQWLKQQQIIIDVNCINTRNEFQQYKWKEDKDGNAIRQPVEKNDHIIDAIRYAYERDMEPSKRLKYKVIDWYDPKGKQVGEYQSARSDEEIERLLEGQIL